MKAKLIFYQNKQELPNKLQKRDTDEFGTLFHCYHEAIDELFVRITSSHEISNQDWVGLGESCYAFCEKQQVELLQLDQENSEKMNVTPFLEGFYKADYHFDRYLSDRRQETVVMELPDQYKEHASEAKRIANAVHVARDICNEPANMLYPESYADYLKKLFADTNVEVNIVSQQELGQAGFYAVETVGKGSVYQPCVAILTLKNAEQDAMALVGKGVTFDSGGVNVKTGSAIAEMKMDLGGAAAVTGAMKLLADSQVPCHVQAILPLVTNVSGANAYLPSDVIQYKDGPSVEVGNTDAEGRLILADAILYAQRQGIRQIVDIATLTGNVGQALGLKMAGIYSNDLKIVTKLYQYGQISGDFVWPLPLEKDYKRYLASQVADISNMSSTPFGGSITAALFIEHFVEAATNWIHIDMANTSKFFPDGNKGASGFGTKLLYELVRNSEELWGE
ncbi:M17 family metallopeptidase [Gracilibacillus phocaeensis]|uniref:M17 family metallopeptidase n=1 Tax=Gracilibacillus phocaeensis TaxID=2042304 RepID=UPI0010310C9F|nr:leucyl aminopeptidase family protein [Gracilibacillus phocaeensis]